MQLRTCHSCVSSSREADRAILVACQQRGASWDTFTHVSAQLGDRTAQQVRGGGASAQVDTSTTAVCERSSGPHR